VKVSRAPGCSCRLSAAGIRFLGHPVPPRNRASLTVGLPDQARLDLDGVSTFRTSEIRLGRVPPLPRERRCPRGRYSLPSRRLPLPSGQPLTSVPHTIPRAHFTRHHQGFTYVHPSSLPRAGNSQMARESLGDLPELRTPALPATHVRAGTDQRTQVRNYTISLPPILHTASSLAPCDLVSHGNYVSADKERPRRDSIALPRRRTPAAATGTATPAAIHRFTTFRTMMG